MRTIMVMNSKGGTGKSTVATNLASYLAAQNHKVALVDLDPQASSMAWLEARPAARPPIRGIAAYEKNAGRVGRTTEYAVMDAPAGLHGGALSKMVGRAQSILIPVLPSPMDMRAATDFIAEIRKSAPVQRKRAKLALLASWLALILLFLATGSQGVASTSEAVQAEPFRNFFIGLTGVLAIVMAGLFFSAFAAVLVGVPLLVLVVVAALILKLWGMVAVFHAVGSWILKNVLGRRASQLDAALVGLVVLGTLKLLPYVGTWVWTVATLVGVGAALTTKFGRREPWFEASEVYA